MFKELELCSPQDTIALAERVAVLLEPGDILCLYGDLGSGKTFFTKALGKQLGITDEIDSPSFVIFKEYQSGRMPLFHLDLYRLKRESELFDLGIFDVLDSGVTVIEWPTLAENSLPYHSLDLHFEFDGTNRKVRIKPSRRMEEHFR